MAAMPIYGENTWKYSSPEPRKFRGWILVYSIGDSVCTEFVQMMFVGWPLTFYGKVKFVPPYICIGKMLKYVLYYVLKFYGWNLQRMIKEVQLFSYRQNVWGFLPLPLSYVHV